MKLRLSISDVLTYFECGRQLWYKKVLRARPRIRSANLAFGTAVHNVCEAFVRGLIAANPVNPVEVFRAEWCAETENTALQYASTWSPDTLEAAGIRLMEQLPEAWEASGLMPLLTDKGEPAIEQSMRVPLGHGVTLSLRADLFAIDDQGRVGLLDYKTPATASTELFLANSDQLTAYQLGGEHHAKMLGIERIDFVGVFELLKKRIPKKGRGEGPKVLPPATVPARPPEVITDLKNKVLWVAQQYHKGAFWACSRQAHNTPCELCDFKNHCVYGDDSDLILPEEKQIALV